ncbi:MAG: DNA repair protein RecO [Elusimicrobiales bacterium]|nr:DNA repair protein RecO [Elusimicrobiales bacterium]
MYFCDKGIVLRHRDIKEFDRVVTIFTKEHGRLEVVFKGVRKSQAKLRSFSELMCHSDFRFYFSKYGIMPLCVGASLIESYMEIRNNIEKLINFIFISDLTIMLTPLSQKSEDKYNLIISALNYLSKTTIISKWFKVVFVMNFFEYFGIGFKKTQLGYDEYLWKILHNGFVDINKLDNFDDCYDKIFKLAFTHLNQNSPKPIDPYIYEYIVDRRINYEFSGYNK